MLWGVSVCFPCPWRCADCATVKVVRQWGQRLLQLAADDARARGEATRGAVLCADIVGINFIVAHFQGMPHSVSCRPCLFCYQASASAPLSAFRKGT